VLQAQGGATYFMIVDGIPGSSTSALARDSIELLSAR